MRGNIVTCLNFWLQARKVSPVQIHVKEEVVEPDPWLGNIFNSSREQSRASTPHPISEIDLTMVRFAMAMRKFNGVLFHDAV